MNPKFIKWLDKQTFNLTSGGYYVINTKYNHMWNWNWNDLKEWDE
jgi:hypothetical protein